MDIDPPRLPRLGGHKSTPACSSSTGPASSAQAPALLADFNSAIVSHSSDRISRPHIDVGYDDGDFPFASYTSSSLSGCAATGTGAGLLQHPTPSSTSASGHPSCRAPADAWKLSMRDEVLCGKPLRQSSPEAAAAVPRETLYSTLEEEEDIDLNYAEEESVQACQCSGSCSGIAHPQNRYPVMIPGSGLARIVVPPIPGMSAIIEAASPVSPCSSIATDTPRSILRQSGTESGWTPRSNSRRISFVGVSPPRPEEHRGRRNGDEESGDDSDDYESAEPSLHYGIETLPTSSTLSPPRHARKVSSSDPSSPNDHDRSHEHSGGNSNRTSSPVSTPQQQQKRASPSLSPERPRLATRSPTHSPPRGSGSGYTISVEPPLSTAVTAPSAPPPPEEEGDEMTLDMAPQYRAREKQHLLKTPTRRGDQRRAKSPSIAHGRDDDVLTQPHNRNEANGSSYGAAFVRRLPPRRRWPSEAYQDDPPTEASNMQRSRRHWRETLDPEADMGSSSNRSGSDMDSNCTDSDDSLPVSNASAQKTHQGSSYRPISSLSPVITHAAAGVSVGVSPSGHPSPHRQRASTNKDSDGVSNKRSPERSSTPLSPPSLTQRNETDEATRNSSNLDHHHVHSSRGAERASGLSAETGKALPAPNNSDCSTQVGEETGCSHTHTGAATLVSRREASYSPSTITNHSSGQSMADDLSGSVSAGAAPEARRVLKSYQRQCEVVPLASSAATAEALPRRSKDRKVTKVMVAEEPQVYVDPLLLERRHRHELSRDELRPHAEQHSPSGRGMSSRHHARKRGQQLPTFEPMSLRDIMMRHDSPEIKSRRGTLSSQFTDKAILRPPSEVQLLQLQHSGDGDNDEAAHAATPRAAALENSATSSSILSSGGVPAEELFWDASMPTPQAGSRSPSPVSPRSSSTMVPKTSDRRKVLRKKLVVVVRRKRGDSAPSANDPVVQMSLLPLKEGTAAVLKANSSLQGSPQQRRTRSSSASSAAATPTLEKLINKVEEGRSASVASRCPSRASERHGHAGENEISEEDRRRFRHALSALSSRSVSRRASPSPSATSKAERSQRSRTCSPGSRSNASNDCARLRRRSGSADEESVLHTSDAAVRSSGHGRRSDGGHRHKSRRRHSHESMAHSAAKHRRRSLSATSMPGAPYCATQNDEFYGTADMAKDVASLIPSPLQERIGITPMSMPLLPRLVLRSEMGVLPPGKYTNHPHCNIDTAQHANGSWSASDDEEGYDVDRITDGTSGGYGSRPLTLQFSSATQTDGVTGVNLALGSARSGMPLLAVTPVQRTAAIGSIGSTHGRGQPSKLIGTSVPTLGEGVVASSLALVHNTAGKAVGHKTTVLTVEGGAENSLLAEEAFVTESPASFVKRTASPAAAKALTGSTSRILSGRNIGASIGRSETNVFGGNVEASRTAADAPWPTHTPPFGGASVHRATSGSQWVTHSPGTVEPAMMDAVVSVPLFVPPLTVDNVSHLSHDWQSTLRERSSKAKRSAMEDFLIASAEAGAAATAAAVAAAAASSPPPYRADSATPDADPYKMFASGCGRLTVPTVGNEAPSERQRRARPAQSHQPLALEEFYGCTVPPADTATVPLSVHALPPQSRSRSCSEIKRDVRQRRGSPGSAAQRVPERRQAKNPSPSPTRSETNSVRGAAAMSADSISKGGATFIKSRDGVEERSTSARKHSRSQSCRASTERGTNSNGDPLTDAVEVEFPSASAADSPRKSSSSSRSRSAIGNGTAANAAAVTATNEAGVRSTLPPPRFFSIVETGTESRSMEKAAGKRHGNQRDKRRKNLSRRSPSEASQSPSSKRRKTSNKHKKHKKRKHRHGRHERYSRSSTHSLSSRTGDAAVVEMDSGSDVDSNLTTSMEFQLSRLLLLREAAVFTEPPPSSTVDASRRSARKKGKAERKATKEAAAPKDENHHHRSRSSRDEKRKRSPQRSTRQHRDRSDTKKKKKGHRRSISPPKPGPLPPPPPHRHSRALYGEETAVGGVSDSIFEGAGPRSNATSRYRRGDGDAFASTRSYFRDGKIFSDGQVESAEAACARYRATGHAGEDSETLYERYRWRSHTSPLRGQRSYAASEATGGADTFRPVDRPAPHPATTVEGPRLWHRSYSSANRPSTRWNDYVQDSESGAASRASLNPYTHAHHSTFLAQKRHSSSTGITKAGERSSRGGAEGDLHSSAQPVPRTYSSTYTNRRRQTCELEDLDDVSIRQYFNDHDQVDGHGGSGGVQRNTHSGFEHPYSRSATSNNAPTARPSLFNNYEQGSAAARKKHVNENDLLVSTPPNDSNGESVPDNARDLNRPRQFQTRGSRAPPLPPPPSPPQASAAPSSAPADTLFAAIPSAGALPIVMEHTVTDAQMAEVFVQGLRDIISSLHQYRNSV